MIGFELERAAERESKSVHPVFARRRVRVRDASRAFILARRGFGFRFGSGNFFASPTSTTPVRRRASSHEPKTRWYMQESVSHITRLMLRTIPARLESRARRRTQTKRKRAESRLDSLLLALAVLEQPAVAAPGEDLVPDPEVGVRRPLPRVVVLHVGKAVDAEPGARGDGEESHRTPLVHLGCF